MMIRWSSLTGWIKRQPEQRMLMILALVVGIGSGLAAVILKQLAHLIDAGLTNWIDSSYDTIFLLLFPGVGMLLSLLFVTWDTETQFYINEIYLCFYSEYFVFKYLPYVLARLYILNNDNNSKLQ